MKRLNYILLAGLSLVAAVSCNKQFKPAGEPEGIPMTLKATIGGPETKLGFNQVGNALKGTWNANEKISVVSVHGRLVSVDTFTTGSESEGQTTADFSGTYTGEFGSSIIVIYPALEEYENEEGDVFYGTTKLNPNSNSEGRLIHDLQENLTYEINTNSSTQSANGSLDHLGDYSLLMGEGTVSDSDLTITLKPQTSVFRITITLDDSYIGTDLYSMAGSFQYGEGRPYFLITTNGLLSTDSISEYLNSRYYFAVEFGSRGTETVPINLTSSDLKFVAYAPFVPYPDSRPESGNRIGSDGANSIDFSIELGVYGWVHKTINLTADKVLESGKVYDIAVTMPPIEE